MVAQAVTWVDVEGAVRAWARETVTSANRRVLFEYDEKSAGPQIVLQRVAGPDADCLIQFDVFDTSKARAAELAAELCTALDALARYAHDDTLLHAAAVESSRWLPDPVSRSPRYVVDATFVASATSHTGS